MMKKYDTIDVIAVVLLLIGGLNWGFIGFFRWDVLASVFGEMSTFTRVVYDLIGLAALWRIYCWIRCQSK
ncbi:MAG TPA: DUF378 domain-containing protein [Chlamydiales bacterium]|nr:DUF378 domain-containing protein [Chlamydiales bacterium]